MKDKILLSLAVFLMGWQKKLQFNRLINKNKFLPEFVLSANSLVKILNIQRGEKKRCHIVGSGSSVIGFASEEIFSEDAIYTCNFGGVLDIPFDFYMFEVATDDPRCAKISELQRKTIEMSQLRNSRNGLVVAKNLWEGKIKSEVFFKKYPGVFMIRDSLLPCSQRLIKTRCYDMLFDKMFSPPKSMIFQVLTTPFTLIQLAYHAGFHEIYVHGLDGVGPHFFHLEGPYTDEALVLKLREAIPKYPDTKKHKVGYPARLLLPEMKKYLHNRGVTLQISGLPI